MRERIYNAVIAVGSGTHLGEEVDYQHCTFISAYEDFDINKIKETNNSFTSCLLLDYGHSNADKKWDRTIKRMINYGKELA